MSCFEKNVWLYYFGIVNQILRYLAGSQDKNIIFEQKLEFCLVGYLDSDWIRDYANKNSISGFVFTLNKRLINYISKK